MKISLQWLNEHVEVEDYFQKPAELARKLTDAGLEVESIFDGSVQFQSVVVGHIQKLDRHPNADRLTVCQVDVGDGTLRQIVCGAKNHKAGDKVVVTLPGAVLPGQFVIKKSKIRDVESLGMLASESELGLKKESEGILILPADAPVGETFAKYYGLDDLTFEINVSPNRADCLSHLGLAREVACLLGRPLRSKERKAKTSSSVVTKKTVDLKVAAPELCSRYAGRVIKGVKVGPSPTWLKRRLESVGLNSINNVVDVTNFVMMDVGQPLHAFDVNSLAGSQIVVDRAKPDEPFKTLDGTELKLSGEELTIRDRERAVCLAGAIGGLNSGVTEKTTTLFIESAHFAMDSVRKTARRHGLQTDSAYRFSRGTDRSGVVHALDLACALIQEVAGGEVAADFWDQQAEVKAAPAIFVSAEYVGQRLGYPVSEEDLEKWLQRLGGQVKKASGGFEITPPSYRVDLEMPEDFVEEYGRLHGYSHIPETLPHLSYAPLKHDRDYLWSVRVGEVARAAGFSQTVNFGFLNRRWQEDVLGEVTPYAELGLKMEAQAVSVLNPLSEDLGVMRVSLLPGLLKNAIHNFRHGQSSGRLFETGYVFRRAEDGFGQDARLGLVAWGQLEGLWDKGFSESRVFFDLKGRLQGLLEQLLIQSVSWNSPKVAPHLAHPGQCASLFIEGRTVGLVTMMHPEWLAKEKIRVPVAVAELDLEALSRGQPRQPKYKPISKFPSVERDLAFVIPKNLRAQDLAGDIRKTAGPLLQSLEVFDVFEGESLPENHCSVAYRMILQSGEETLSEERLTALQAQIVAAVTKKWPAKVR
ncbi:MAG: phenylalanine--tRNA ligase subunit beta [Bdellovibrionales bacterium]